MACGYKPQNGPFIFQTLTANGATAQQATAILANMWHESKWDPQCDAIDTNGKPSVGLVEWNNNATAAGLLTGNDQADILSQVRYLVSSGGLQATGAGTNVGQLAANFAHSYERCAACGYQGGNGELVSRAATAVALYPLATSNRLATYGGGSGSTNVTGATNGTPNATLTSATDPNCILPLKFSIPLIGGPNLCLWYKGWSRAFLGAMLLGTGAIVGIAGLILLVGSEKANVAAKIPGRAGTWANAGVSAAMSRIPT